jgi:phosphatidylglycerol:prolipoprotein diacylglycerol transferase
MSIDQFGIHLGPLYLRYYGLILVTGAFVAGYLASVEAGRRGKNPDHVWDGIIWALIGGIVGARLWHIFTPPPSMVAQGLTTQFYLTHPLDAINTMQGGLGLPGAVAGGVLGLYLFTRFAKLNFLEWLDIAAVAIPLGQAIGRWGNYVNQELYGAPTTLPWGLSIDAAHRVPGFTDPALKFHPTFLYESIGNLLICLALLCLARRYTDRLKTGDLFIIYAILYPILRFALEFIRLDSSQIFGLNANQTTMAIVAIVALGVLLARHRKARRYEMKAQTPIAE